MVIHFVCPVSLMRKMVLDWKLSQNSEGMLICNVGSRVFCILHGDFGTRPFDLKEKLSEHEDF